MKVSELRSYLESLDSAFDETQVIIGVPSQKTEGERICLWPELQGTGIGFWDGGALSIIEDIPTLVRYPDAEFGQRVEED